MQLDHSDPRAKWKSAPGGGFAAAVSNLGGRKSGSGLIRRTLESPGH